MPRAVERDFLGDASGLQPVFQGCLCHLVCKADKDGTSSSFTNQLQCLVTDGVVHQFLGFLHTKCDIHSSVTVWLYVLPCELFDVTLAESGQTGKEEAVFKTGYWHGVFANLTSSSLDKCSFSVGMVSIRSKKPFGFSIILCSL